MDSSEALKMMERLAEAQYLIEAERATLKPLRDGDDSVARPLFWAKVDLEKASLQIAAAIRDLAGVL